MSVMRGYARCTRSERGQVIVFFALLMPVIFAVGSIVMSVGNWYVLKRHLQTQVDAARPRGRPRVHGMRPGSSSRRIRRSRSRRSSTRATPSAAPHRTTCNSSKPATSGSS